MLWQQFCVFFVGKSIQRVGAGDETVMGGFMISLETIMQVVGDGEELALRSISCCFVQKTNTESRNIPGYWAETKSLLLCTQKEKEMRLV